MNIASCPGVASTGTRSSGGVDIKVNVVGEAEAPRAPAHDHRVEQRRTGVVPSNAATTVTAAVVDCFNVNKTG